MNDSDSVLSYVSTKSILQDSDDLTLIISRTGKIILINRRGCEILGRSEEEITGMNWFNDLIPEHERDRAADEFRGNLGEPDKVTFKQDYQVLSAQGTEKQISWHNRVITDEDGIVMCVLVSGHIIVDPAEYPAYHNKNEEMYESLVENSNDAILIHRNGKILFANRTALRLIDQKYDEFLGTNVLDYIAPGSKALVMKNMTDRLSGKDVKSIYKIGVLKKNGDIIPIEIRVSVIHFDGDPALMVLFRDLSEGRALEQQILQAQKMEAVGQLAGGAAHDFNNILQVITGYTELAQASHKIEDPAYEMLQQISLAAGRAGKLVKQLLTFSRNQLIVTRILDINKVITEHLSMLKSVIDENIILEFDPSADVYLINADKGMLEQILMNICLNSRDAMPDGGKILVKTEQIFLDKEFCTANPSAEKGPYVMMSISDTGSGMDEETLGRIFEPFFSTKGITEGTGLGLSTVYGIVIQHDGIITASSEPDVGSIFRVYLPITDDKLQSEDQLPEYDTEENTSRTIVITEDDETVRTLACKILTEAGHEVIQASNGEEAVLLISDSPDSVDLVILDVIMPVLGGYETADRIRKICPDMPLIFCSGYSEDTNNDNIYHDRKSSIFLSKPYSMTQLLSAISDLFAET